MARINDLILDVWVATERSGPRYDEFRLTSRQHAVLSLIVTRPGTGVGALADALGVTRGAVSQHLGVLEREGYIVRTRSDSDGRVQVLRLGPRGVGYREVTLRFEQYLAERLRASLAAEEIDGIADALERLRDALRG